MFYALKILAVTVSTLIIGLCIAGFVYQKFATYRDLKKYPPFGRMVDVGGFKLNILESGQQTYPGQPTVILDGGLGSSLLDWGWVQPEIAKFARVCSYDRAGRNWSEASPAPRTGEYIVKELHTLLHNANMPTPYILVGHSFGGFDVQLYASTYPEDVAGIILIDGSHEKEIDSLLVRMKNISKHFFKILWLQKAVLAPLGIVRLQQQVFGAEQMRESLKKLRMPDDFFDMRIANRCKTTTVQADCGEILGLKKFIEQLRATEQFFGNIPLTVISAGLEKYARDLRLGQVQEEEIKKMIEMKQQEQDDLKKRSNKSTLVFAENSGHLVPYEQPEIIVDEVYKMLEQYK